jgi:hypothetical protein
MNANAARERFLASASLETLAATFRDQEISLSEFDARRAALLAKQKDKDTETGQKEVSNGTNIAAAVRSATREASSVFMSSFGQVPAKSAPLVFGGGAAADAELYNDGRGRRWDPWLSACCLLFAWEQSGEESRRRSGNNDEYPLGALPLDVVRTICVRVVGRKCNLLRLHEPWRVVGYRTSLLETGPTLAPRGSLYEPSRVCFVSGDDVERWSRGRHGGEGVGGDSGASGRLHAWRGLLVVADTGNDRIAVFQCDHIARDLSPSVAMLGSLSTRDFGRPTGVVVLSNGDIVVAARSIQSCFVRFKLDWSGHQTITDTLLAADVVRFPTSLSGPVDAAVWRGGAGRIAAMMARQQRTPDFAFGGALVPTTDATAQGDAIFVPDHTTSRVVCVSGVGSGLGQYAEDRFRPAAAVCVDDFDPDAPRLLVGFTDGQIHAYSLPDHFPGPGLGHRCTVLSVCAISVDPHLGNVIVTSGNGNYPSVRVHDRDTFELLFVVGGAHITRSPSHAVSDGKHVIVCDASNSRILVFQ